MKTVMVFGASGTLGTYLVDALAAAGYGVWAVGRRNIVPDYYSSRGIDCAEVDICDPESFGALPEEGIDCVIQIAGAMPSRMPGYRPSLYLEVNTLGTLNVLEYCRHAGVERHFYMQSHSDVAGHWNTGELIPANALRKPMLGGDHAIYIISKMAGGDLVEHYRIDHGLNAFVFRLPTIYCFRPIYEMYVAGEARPLGYRYLIQKAMAGDPIEIWGDPRRTKDIVYVKDYTQMMLRAVEAEAEGGIYNVASGVGTSLEDQVRGVIRVFCEPGQVSSISHRPDMPSQNSYLYDISNARAELGYEPSYGYLDMLEDMKLEMSGNRFDHLAGHSTDV